MALFYGLARRSGRQWPPKPFLVEDAGGRISTGTAKTRCGYPLYSSNGTYRNSSEVAKLYGEFWTIDGRNVVGGGRSFELLPGCHVVITRRTWIRGSTVGGMVADTPNFVFALKMQANRMYVVEWEDQTRNGMGGTIKLIASELDADGEVVTELEPTTDEAAIQECRAHLVSSKYVSSTE